MLLAVGGIHPLDKVQLYGATPEGRPAGMLQDPPVKYFTTIFFPGGHAVPLTMDSWPPMVGS